MSYEVKEASTHDGQPIECFEFVSNYTTYRYTSYDRTVVVASQTFEPLAIKRSTIKAGTHEEDNLDIQVEIPATSRLAKDCAYYLTPPRLTMTIYRVHEGDDFATDYVIYWKGPVANLSVDKNIATIRVPSVFSNLLSGHVPSVFYQNPCNHVLFDGGCKIVRASHNVTTTIVLVSPTALQIASVGGFPDQYFKGGEVVNIPTGERRLIIDHTADTIQINYPFGEASIGQAVEVTAGCDHSYEGDCKLKFSNQVNYGGFPFIPTINPFIHGF